MNKHEGSSFKEYLESLPDETAEGPDGNIHVMPKAGPKHIESKDCWCEPEVIQDARAEGGCLAYLHKEMQ